MITVFAFIPAFGVPNPSPFCMKVEILLQMAGLPYETRIEGDPRKAPKGKIPFIRDGDQVIGDSTFIQRHLETKYGAEFDQGLNAQEHAVSHAFARMAEERLYWCLVYSRWMDDSNWPKVKAAFFSDLPPIIRSIVSAVSRKSVRASLHGHGLGRHSRDEVYALGEKDIAALADHLGSNSFMMGDNPTSLDAVLYPLVEGLMIEELPSPLLTGIRRHKNLQTYRDRCRAQWYPGFK
jgi:glutathione S-transferase